MKEPTNVSITINASDPEAAGREVAKAVGRAGGPYEIGACYWLKTGEHQQSLIALVAEVFVHELVLTEVRVAPDGPVVYGRLVVGRSDVREAREVTKGDPTAPRGRRVTVKG